MHVLVPTQSVTLKVEGRKSYPLIKRNVVKGKVLISLKKPIQWRRAVKRGEDDFRGFVSRVVGWRHRVRMDCLVKYRVRRFSLEPSEGSDKICDGSGLSSELCRNGLKLVGGSGGSGE